MENKRLNVCLITLRPEYKLGGQTESIINLAGKLLKKNINVCIMDPLDSNLLSCNQIKEHKSGREVSFFKIFFVLRMLLRVILTSKNYDVMQLHLPTPAFAIIGDFLKITTFKPVVIVFEGHLIDFSLSDILKNIRKDFSFYFIRYLINNKFISAFSLKICRHYAVSTNYQKNEILSLGYSENKISVIPNSTDIEKYTPTVEGVKEFDNLPINNNLLLYIGHFWDTKGVTDLLESFNLLVNEYSDLKLVLAWSGLGKFKPINEIITKYNLENKVIILGKVQVQNLLVRAKILILPYKYSFSTVIFPNLILEAFAVGVPVLSTSLEPIKEIIEDNKTGFLAQPSSPSNLAKKIKEILSYSETSLNEIILNQKAAISTKFNPNVIAENFINIYSAIAAEKN